MSIRDEKFEITTHKLDNIKLNKLKKKKKKIKKKKKKK